MGAVILPVVGLLIMFTLIVMFFSKKNIPSYETKIYKLLLITATIFIIIGLLTFVIAKTTNDFKLIEIFQKLYMSFLVILNYLSVIYCVRLFQNDNKYLIILNMVIGIFTIIFIGLILILPLNVIFYGDVLDGDGWAYNIAIIDTIISFVIFIVITIYLILNKITIKKLIPFIMLIMLYIISFILRVYYKELIFEGFFYSYILLIMYHTIENPDMKLLNEAHKSKEISDSANEEKTLFLYNMTQEIRNITGKIDDNADYILENKNYGDICDSARDIKALTSKFTTMTNDILDVSKMDAANIKVYNEKYNIKTIIKQLVNIYRDICKDKNLKFIVNVDNNIPDILYGDGIGLKEVLTIVLNNSTKYIEKGFIELDINVVIKNDICRLMFTIEDSGFGIKSEDITETDKYYDSLENIKILVVDDSDTGLKIIERLLKGNKMEVDKAATVKECIDKVKINKYDLILIDEELSQISSMYLIAKLKNIRNFNTPVILLTKNNNYEYNDEYKNSGFTGYVLKSLKKEIFIDELNKFVKK